LENLKKLSGVYIVPIARGRGTPGQGGGWGSDPGKIRKPWEKRKPRENPHEKTP